MQTAKGPAPPNNCVTCIAHAEGVRGPCYLHSPERAEERRRNTSRAARAKASNGETKKLKIEIREIIADVKAGTQDRNDATAIFQGYRVLKDLIELERRVKETDELAREISELREELA